VIGLANSIRVVLVGVEGEINLGAVIRLCKNFDVDELYLVKPLVDPFSSEVRRFAARGASYLDTGRVKVVESLDDALRGLDISACTSSIVNVGGGDVLRIGLGLEEFVNIAQKYNRVGVVFGRESVGLTRDEIAKCDLLVHIEANPEYPTLNLSHAVAIVLYELYRKTKKRSVLDLTVYPSEDDFKIVDRYLEQLARIVASDERQYEQFLLTSKRLIRRATPTKIELALITTFVRRALNAAMKGKHEGAEA